jgi:hypothetical protein
MIVGFIEPDGTSFQSAREERTEKSTSATIKRGRISDCQYWPSRERRVSVFIAIRQGRGWIVQGKFISRISLHTVKQRKEGKFGRRGNAALPNFDLDGAELLASGAATTAQTFTPMITFSPVLRTVD